jgi:hypothetical protein
MKTMHRIPTRPTAAALLAPLSLLTGLPTWCGAAVICTSVALTVVHELITQAIRWRVGKRITTSAHALRVLEIEDLRLSDRDHSPRLDPMVRRAS